MLYVLPETAGDIIVIQATETLTNDDYQDQLLPQLIEKGQQFSQVRVVFYLDNNFTGFQADSTWADANFAQQHLGQFKRFAVVADTQWNSWATALHEQLENGEAKYFSGREFLDALHWVDSSDA